MTAMSHKIAIVGCGPGSPAYLTDAARSAVASADAVLGNKRLLAMFPSLVPGTLEELPGDVEGALGRIAARRDAGDRIAVLVSGDPGVFSLAQPVVNRFGRDACEIISGISSVQVAFARVKLDWCDARILSVHGREPPCAPPMLAGSGKIAILAGTRDAMRWAADVANVLLATHVTVVCENLTLDKERIAAMCPTELLKTEFGSLTIVLLIPRSLIG